MLPVMANKTATLVGPEIDTEGALASAREPKERVRVSELLPVPLNEIALLLRLNVRPVVVAVVQRVAVPVPVIVHVPTPMVTVRVLELEEENNPMLKFFPLASRVPLVRVTVLVLPTVRLSANWKVPPTPSKVRGKSSVTALLVMLCVPEVAPKVVALAPAVKAIPLAMVRLP